MAKRWHFPSLKLAIEAFVLQEKPKAFDYASIEKQVKSNYTLLDPERNTKQSRQRWYTGALKQAIPKVDMVKENYVRRESGKNGVEIWDGTTLMEGRAYYKLKTKD